MRGREAEGGVSRAVTRMVTGGWTAVAVAVLAVAKRLGGSRGAQSCSFGAD